MIREIQGIGLWPLGEILTIDVLIIVMLVKLLFWWSDVGDTAEIGQFRLQHMSPKSMFPKGNIRTTITLQDPMRKLWTSNRVKSAENVFVFPILNINYILDVQMMFYSEDCYRIPLLCSKSPCKWIRNSEGWNRTFKVEERELKIGSHSKGIRLTC